MHWNSFFADTLNMQMANEYTTYYIKIYFKCGIYIMWLFNNAKQVITTTWTIPSSPWNQCLLLNVITSFLYLILAILDMTYPPILEFLLHLSPDYAPCIALTSTKLLVVTLLSFLSRIYTMLFDSLALEKLKMLSKWPKHFRIAPTNHSPPKLYEIAWRKWGWRLW